MFRAFLRVPVQIVESFATTAPSNTHSLLLLLPNHILDAVLDHLAILDRCALALTCKYIFHHAHENEHLEYIISSPPSLPSLQDFFTRQLSTGWIPPYLRYCPDCGKFVSIEETHWRHVSEKCTRELTGRVAMLWRERREDGWLRYWIERWCHDDQPDDKSTAKALKLEDTTDLLCPRCAIVNPDTNAWRTRRLEKRNAKHRDNNPGSPSSMGSGIAQNRMGMAALPARDRARSLVKSRFLLSPGLHSPPLPSPPPLPHGLTAKASEEQLISKYRQVPAWI